MSEEIDPDFEAFVILNYAPEDISGIEELVRSRDSFVALLSGDLYQLMYYLDPRISFEFVGHLDRNIYSRITSLVKGCTARSVELPDLRWAAAILAFSQIAKITFDYASSVYELASSCGGEEAVKEVRSFRIADNSSPQVFIDFALGRIDAIPHEALAQVQHTDSISAAQFEKRTNDFRIHYLFALKIAALSQQNIEPVEKMIRFIDWMHTGFLFGSAALLFANRYFSPSRHRRMLKGYTKRDLQNAAWDMTLVHNWRRSALTGAKTDTPAILMSGDKALKDIARRVTAELEEEYVGQIRDVWGRSVHGMRVFNHYSQAWKHAQADANRRSKVPNYARQLELIEALERHVIGPTTPET